MRDRVNAAGRRSGTIEDAVLSSVPVAARTPSIAPRRALEAPNLERGNDRKTVS
jgi:hypothetical protein